jgi:very-short-patch-repair endonuclease
MDKKRMHAGAVKPLYQRARELRNNATHAEEILWGYLKNKPLGFKFRRQHPYSIYILDFYCHSLKLVIEVDGKIHEHEDVKLNDNMRQELVEKDGVSFLRFSNEQIMKSLEIVIKETEEYISYKQ